MALGGGTFTAQNKVLPGAYINFISAQRASSLLGDRGVCALPVELSWGPEGKVFEVTQADFIKDSLLIFGYSYDSDKMKGLRDLFRNATRVFLYRLNTGVKASNDLVTAKYGGIRGNDITMVVQKNVDDATKYDVITMLDHKKVDTQTIKTVAELTGNTYVTFKEDAILAASAGIPLTGGTDGETVTGDDYQTFLDKIEPYAFNVLGCLATTAEVSSLFTAFTKRMRDEVGAKFQTVLYKADLADYEGVISVANNTTTSGWPESSAIYWVAGAQAGCGVNQSLTNRTYDGEFELMADYTQRDLEKMIQAGKFVLHKVGSEIRVLDDINTYTSYSAEKNEDFGSNQTIRVLDQIAMDIAGLFNSRYLGKVPNNEAGRISLWNDIVTQHKELERLQAIENFDSKDVVVAAGGNKKSVVVSDAVTPVNAMAQLYMSVVVE